MTSFLSDIDSYVNFSLRTLSPSQVIRRTLLGVVVGCSAFHLYKLSRSHGGYRRAVVYVALRFLQKAPITKGLVSSEKAKTMKQVEKLVTENKETAAETKSERIPERPLEAKMLIAKMTKWSQIEEKHWNKGQVSGGIYHGEKDLLETLTTVYGLFALSNPLHPEVFPFVRKMEAEVVRMTINLFNGNSTCCGTMTAGGTESILMALKSYRDQAKAEKGIEYPEIVIPTTAHAAFVKGAHYFGIKVHKTRVDPETFRADLEDLEAHINRNTIVIVGSCPAFPQGIMDNIPQLGQIALKHKVGLHVDGCLGGFLMPWLSRIGFPPPYAFDFQVPGVTSISADTHKYGYAPKGSSVIMYSTPNLRSYQYFVAADWVGGIYASPSMPGSRPGGLIAATWAAMMLNGEENYLKCAIQIMNTAREITSGIPKIKGLKVLGKPDMSVVAFATTEEKLNIFKVGEAMTHRGWNLNSLQSPASIHLCCTYVHRNCSSQFLADLQDAVDDVRNNPHKFKDGAAAIYGLAESIPDTELIDDIAKSFIDALFIV